MADREGDGDHQQARERTHPARRRSFCPTRRRSVPSAAVLLGSLPSRTTTERRDSLASARRGADTNRTSYQTSYAHDRWISTRSSCERCCPRWTWCTTSLAVPSRPWRTRRIWSRTPTWQRSRPGRSIGALAGSSRGSRRSASTWRATATAAAPGVQEIPSQSWARSTAQGRGPEERALSAVDGAAVHRALWTLPEEQRVAIALVDLADLSIVDAADVMGTPKGTVLSPPASGPACAGEPPRRRGQRGGAVSRTAHPRDPEAEAAAYVSGAMTGGGSGVSRTPPRVRVMLGGGARRSRGPTPGGAAREGRTGRSARRRPRCGRCWRRT